MLQVYSFLLLEYQITQSVTTILFNPYIIPMLITRNMGWSHNLTKNCMSFCTHTSLDSPMGLHQRPPLKSLPLSPPVCAFSAVAGFPFISSHWYMRAFLFHDSCLPGQPHLMVRFPGQFISSGISPLGRYFARRDIWRYISLSRR